MASNKQQQEEEVQILQLILEKGINSFGNDNDQFEIDVEFQLPSPFSVSLVDGPHQRSNSIEHLPPLVLTVHFHEGYPTSSDPPTFVLSSCYLSNRYLVQLCQKLDQIWEENIGMSIVYHWIESLKDALISTKGLRLSTADANDNSDADGDPRAMSSYEPAEAARIYQQLLDYNQEKENERFLHDYHECPICLTASVPGREMLRLYKCRHAYCQACLHDYAKMHIDTGSVEWLLCPDSQCQLALLPVEVRTIVRNDALYEKYERLLLQKSLEQMLDVVWCPRCQNAVLTGAEGDNLAMCDQCRFTFCKKCKNTYHSQTPCANEVASMELKRKRQKLREQMLKLGLSFTDEQMLLREMLASATIESTTRLCPNAKCQVPIEKNLGCDHMFCTRCRTSFSWSDAQGEAAEAQAFVKRFDSDLSRAQKALSDELNPESTAGFVDPMHASTALLSELLIKRTKKCPNVKCAKFNVKYGTRNYLICQHCKRGYCFICGQAVVNEKGHFGAKCARNST